MTTEASVIKDRPAQLRRRPRPAPDETVDPVDYNPATHAPPAPAAAPATVEEAPADGGGGEQEPTAVEPVAAPAEAAAAPEEEEKTQVEAPAQTATVLAAPPAPVQAAAPVAAPAKPRASKAKATPNRKSQRREVTFPLSTRVSQEILDLLYDAQENEGVTLRDAIEQGVRMRWGSSR